MITVLRDARIFNGVAGRLNEGATVVVEDDRIREITTTPVASLTRESSTAAVTFSCRD